MTSQENLVSCTDVGVAAADAQDAKIAAAKAAVDALFNAINVVERAENPDVSS